MVLLFTTSKNLQMKLRAKWRLMQKKKKPLIMTDCNHLFWQKQAVEVADTLFTLWKQTSPGGTTN